ARSGRGRSAAKGLTVAIKRLVKIGRQAEDGTTKVPGRGASGRPGGPGTAAAGLRTVPVRSAWPGTKGPTCCNPPHRADMLRTGTVRGPGGNFEMRQVGGRILKPPPKARGNGPRLCAEHQPQRHGEATRFGIIQRLCASALAAAGPSDTAAVRWWFQDAPCQYRVINPALTGQI